MYCRNTVDYFNAFTAGYIITEIKLPKTQVCLFQFVTLISPCNYLFGGIDILTTVSQPQRADCLVGWSSGECCRSHAHLKRVVNKS